MNLNYKKYFELKSEIESKDFYNNYESIKKGLFIFSYLANIAIIFFGYFFLYSLLREIEPGANSFVLSSISLVFLGGYEILKRVVTDKWSIEFVKRSANQGKELLYLSVFAGILFCGSFYVSLHGAEKFTNKTEQIVDNLDKQVVDSVNVLRTEYDNRVLLIKKELEAKEKSPLYVAYVELKTKKAKTNSPSMKEKYQTEIESLGEDVKKIEADVTNLKTKITEVESEETKAIVSLETKLKEKAQVKTVSSSNASTKFIVLSVLFEIMILGGIWFRRYFDWRSLVEWNATVENNPKVTKWMKWNSLLDIMYQAKFTPLKPGETIPKAKDLVYMAKMNEITITDNEVNRDFYKTLTALSIIKTKGSKRYIEQNYDKAKDLLNRQFNIKME